MKYLFKTTTTMKEYNRKKYWIDGKIVPEFICEANSLDEALVKYQAFVEEKCYITISKTALKNKEPMYIDIGKDHVVETKQVGYVLTGSYDFDDGRNCNYSKQFINLWVDMYIVEYPKFD